MSSSTSTAVTGATDLLAGTTVEGLRDGPALDGWLAQPAGLAVDGDRTPPVCRP